MSTNQYTFNLLGPSITIRTEEDIRYIKQLESRLAATITEVREELGMAEPLTVALMAGIFLADENFKLKRQAPSNVLQNSKAEGELIKLGHLLDQALKEF